MSSYKEKDSQQNSIFMNYKNKPILFAKTEISRIQRELEEEIPQIIKEFNLFFKCKEPISIKYNFEEYEKGYSCSGDLYFGNKLIKHYDLIDCLIYDLNEMALNSILKDMKSNEEEETL